VFTGASEKVPESCLKRVFRVRKAKILAFLQFLHDNNHLYRNVELDEAILGLYPDDGVLPGICDRIIVNKVKDPNETFNEESASFEPHPGTQLYESGGNASAESPHIFLESTGVFDCDGANILARMLTSSTISNLIPRKKGEPDLVIHRAADPTPEYGNTDLFPGMFPTLFPYGTGGFDDDSRSVPIGFRV
jgi:hypothetical protein